MPYTSSMAWQVLLLKLPSAARSAKPPYLPVDFVPPSLGDAADVVASILAAGEAAHATCDLADVSFAVFRTEDFVVEADIADDRVLLNVLGSAAALPLVGALAHALGADAIDCETDAVLDSEAIVPDTLRQWQIRIDELL